MKRVTKYYKHMHVARLNIALLVIFLNIILMPSLTTYKKTGDNLFHVFLNEVDCGYIGAETDVNDLLAAARIRMADGSDSVIYADAELRVESSEVVFGEVDSDYTVISRMTDALNGNIYTTRQPAMTLKIDDYSVNLENSEAVLKVLQTALDKYQDGQQFIAQLVADPSRELNCLTASVVTNEEAEKAENPVVTEAGFGAYLTEGLESSSLGDELKNFDDYEYGLKSMSFTNTIEIVDAYLLPDQIADTDEAVTEITEAKDTDSVYEVQSGDTLSQIAEKVDIPMDKIIEMNDTLDDENSMIRAGEELVITVPEPILSVQRSELEYVEEVYDDEVQYVLNDDWYTTDQETLQQPSSGFRNIVAETTYVNDKSTNRDVVKEEILLEAVPKIVEKGTKIPPTYIKPLSGGRLSSTFGYRKRPNVAGATAYHGGVDWATPVGTPVYASCGGTVSQAGWMSGYGYCVFINHPDGRQTRYAHLSRVLVSKGQSVSQGQVIAKSGNTGASTGPHVHFEIRINGTAVNPLKYLN